MNTCAHCGGEQPADATFCPSCGRRTAAPEPVERDVPIDVQHAQPRFFGLAPPVFVLSAAVALLVLGVVLLLTGAFAVGVIAIVLAFCLLPTFLAGARRWPDTRVARAGVSAAERFRDEAGAAADSVSAWSRASREVARLRKEQFGLRRGRAAKIRELGVAVFEDDPRADELKAEAKELDERIAANDRRLQKTIASARRRVRKERAAVVSTEVIERDGNPLAVETDAEAIAADADQPITREEPEVEPEQVTDPAAEPAGGPQARSR